MIIEWPRGRPWNALKDTVQTAPRALTLHMAAQMPFVAAGHAPDALRT